MKKPSNSFSKFSSQRSNAAKKEQFKQEKRKIKKEREAFFEEKKRAARGGPVDNTRVARGGKPGFHDPKEGFGKGKKDNGPVPGGQVSFPNESTGMMPLNKFIAHSGICARREAAEVVKKGLVKVNGELVTEPGHKVSARDKK